jgi:ACS family hexuronate transporter-like MFS transporter
MHIQTTTRVGRFRWIICGLLFLAATINYIDRQVIGILKSTLQPEFGWSEIDYSDIVFSFQLAYAIGFIIAGRLIDRIGTRAGFALALTIWSLAAMAHAAATTIGTTAAVMLGFLGLNYSASVAGFIVARFALGLGESGNFPAAIKTVAEWFPRSERALATGLFNAGTNIGAIVTPLIVPFITLRFGWRWAFLATGLIGFGWLALWWHYYDRPDRHPRVGAAELAYISTDPPDRSVNVAWRTLLPHRQTWAVAMAKFMTDPSGGCTCSGFLTSSAASSGFHCWNSVRRSSSCIWSPTAAVSSAAGYRQRCWRAAGQSIAHVKPRCWSAPSQVVPIVAASRVENMWTAVALISIAAAAHQGWSANVYTLASDMFPRQAVGSVIGFAGMAGAVGGMLIAKITGYLLQTTGSYLPVFTIAGTTYLITLAGRTRAGAEARTGPAW